MEKRNTGFRDQHGVEILEDSLCRQWLYDPEVKPEMGYHILETVKWWKDDWYLFDITYEYDLVTEFPPKLSEHHDKLEVLGEDQQPVGISK